MFNTAHILYMIISFSLAIVGLVLCGKFIKKEETKKLVLKISALTTVALHYSVLYVDFFSTGSAEVASPLLLPIYPCNVMMWLLLILAFKKKSDTKFAKVLYEFTFYAGVVCGLIGLIFNENYANTPTLADWDSLHGLLSHSTMVFGCLYILVGKFIKIDTSNCISVFFGLCLFLVDGVIINGLYLIFGLGECNSMYLQEIPFPDFPWLNTFVMGILGLLLVFIVATIVEICTKPKCDRFLTKLYNKIFKKQKINTKENQGGE